MAVGPPPTTRAVHLAARIAALAQANQILVSRTVTDLLIGSDIVFDDAGEHALRGAPQTWHLHAVRPEA